MDEITSESLWSPEGPVVRMKATLREAEWVSDIQWDLGPTDEDEN